MVDDAMNEAKTGETKDDKGPVRRFTTGSTITFVAA
jgi:hypothetical protein